MVLGHDLNAGHRTKDVRISEDVSFDTMLLREATLRGLKKAGFLKPSPVQLYGIPLGKCGFDLLLEAKSGTGKTAVFTVISLEKVDLNKGVQTIVLAPTREIASQISSVFIEIGSRYKGLNIAVVMGGLPVKDDIEKFKENVHIVVGSPGRLRHLIQDKHIDISCVRLIVLDEADKLMERSFQPDINYIFSLLPKQKQVIMSSATYSDETKEFISNYVQKAQHVCPDSNSVLLGISQKVTIVPHNSNIVKQTKHRYEELKKILSSKQFKQCLIFCNYQARVGELHRMLSRDKWPAEQLYGQQDQSDRLDALKTLQEYKCRILVSTDLAARGIDASNVDVIINFEPPNEWQTYLHRIGRAGRYGSYGIAISILSEGKEMAKFKKVLALTNIQFNLHNLWNDDPFNLSLDNTVEKTEVPVAISPNTTTSQCGDKSEDMLWKALTLEPFEQHNINLEISSFNEFCESYKMSSKPNIETFSDLMHSFKINKNELNNNKITYEFKHVKFAKLPMDSVKHWDSPNSEYANQVSVQLNFDSLVKTLPNITKGNYVSEMESDRKKITEVMEKERSEKYLSQCVDMASPKMLRYKNTEQNSNINKDQVTLLKDHKNKLDETKTYLINQNSINMGSPTTFGKNKQNKLQTKITKYKDNESDPLQLSSVNANSTASNKKKQDKICSNIDDDNNNNANGTKINHNDEILIDTDVTTLENRKQNNHNVIHSYYDSDHYARTTDNTEIDPVKQALIDAGLPIAFGKPKRNKNLNKVNSYYHPNKSNEKIKIEKPKAKPIQQKSLKTHEIGAINVNKVSSSKTFTRDSYKQNCLSNTIIKNDPLDSISVSSTNEKNTSKLRRNNHAAYASTYNKTSCHHQSVKHSNSMEQNRGKQFDTWYKQLQHQTRSIQFVMYIEELRNL